VTTAVLDTNVLASGFRGVLLSTSTPGELIRDWLAGSFELIISEHILSELERTFRTRYFSQALTPEQIADALAVIRRRARLVAITVEVQGVATHPEDDPVLATAVSAAADYLVTGDRQLLRLGDYQGVAIVSPRAMAQVLAALP